MSQLLSIAVLTGLFWWQRGGGKGGNTLLAASDVVGLLFFELLFPAFQVGGTALIGVVYACVCARKTDDFSREA